MKCSDIDIRASRGGVDIGYALHAHQVIVADEYKLQQKRTTARSSL